MLRLILLVWLICAGPAHAGAWPRGQGNLFMMLGTYSGETGGYTGVYAEWGLTDRLTFGVDLGRGVSGASKTIAFGRLPLLQSDNGHVVSAELGVGKINGHPALRPGVSWGKGLSFGQSSGWMGLEVSAEIDMDRLTIDAKADLTLGVTLSERRMMIVQLQTGQQAGDDPFLRVVPSLVFGRSGQRRLELGLTQGLYGDRATGLKIGVWTEF